MATPTPMPAFAPVESPLSEEEEVGAEFVSVAAAAEPVEAPDEVLASVTTAELVAVEDSTVELDELDEEDVDVTPLLGTPIVVYATAEASKIVVLKPVEQSHVPP